MSEDVKRVKKVVEVDVVEMKIEISEAFFNQIEKAKKEVADKRGFDVSYGEYLEECMNDLVQMVGELSGQVQKASGIIQEQDAALAEAEVVVNPKDPESGEEEPAPDELYAHIIADEDKGTMYQ